VILSGGRDDRRPVIGWNYHSNRLKQFTSSFPPDRSRYQVLEPTDAGLVLDL
jgi:hypothetical protein